MEREVVGEDRSNSGPRLLTCGHAVPESSAVGVGATVFCQRCHALEMPADFVSYKETPVFRRDTVPAGLLRDHSTKAGVWGRIVVRQGQLRYHVARLGRSWDLSPGVDGVIAPQDLHHVEPLDESVEFTVQFFRARS